MTVVLSVTRVSHLVSIYLLTPVTKMTAVFPMHHAHSECGVDLLKNTRAMMLIGNV